MWDGFSIRRELVWAVGCQFSLFLVTGITIFTKADQITAESGADDGQLSNLSKSSSALDRFNAFLTLTHELLLISRTVLMFHVSVALPLVESYDLNALPVLKARMRLGVGGHNRDPSLELRDRSVSVSHRQGRADSQASDGFLLDGSRAGK